MVIVFVLCNYFLFFPCSIFVKENCLLKLTFYLKICKRLPVVCLLRNIVCAYSLIIVILVKDYKLQCISFVYKFLIPAQNITFMS